MKISIPNPCSENWNQMTPSEKGRFCTSCQTQVINFTEMPVEEIKQFLEQETGATCGRFSRHQIEAFNAAYQELPSPSNLKRWTMAAVLAGVSALPTFAQDSPISVPAPLLNTSVSYYHNEVQTTEIRTPSDTIELTGQIIDAETDEAIFGATIIVKGTKIGSSTDLDGKFRLIVPKSKETMTLEVHYLGYITLFHDIVPYSTQNLILKMEEDDVILGGMVGIMIVSKKQRRANKRAYRKELREERKRERTAKKEQKS